LQENDKMRRYTSKEKGKQQLMTADANELMMNLDYFWQGSYPGLMMEQIKNSQKDNMILASYQVNKL
jgi:hypothetical protein